MKFYVGSLVIGALIGVAGSAILLVMLRRGDETLVSIDAGAIDGLQSDDATASPSTVTLTSQKRELAALELVAADLREMRRTSEVPGRLQYDESRHLAIASMTAGIVTDVRVQPGDRVSAGQTLAVLSSPDVGSARAEVLQQAANRKLAQQKADWQEATRRGVEKLIDAIESQQNAKSIEAAIEGEQLGEVLARILPAYSRLQLAQKIALDSQSLATSGAVAGRTIQQRRSEVESASAALLAELQQARFETTQAADAAMNAAEDARRRWQVARQHLSTLLGYDEPDPESRDETTLSEVEIHSPLSGTVETRNFSKNERLEANQPIFILADTSRLWVAADIRDRQWAAVSIEPGETIDVSVPAMEDAHLAATVQYVGRQVDPQSGAVPVIASVENTADRLRPGQFVRVLLPLSPPRLAVTVPSSAVVQHEGESFVFVPGQSSIETGQSLYRRVDVQTGIETAGRIEIRLGLAAGDEVVGRGAFLLKSELLLEREAD